MKRAHLLAAVLALCCLVGCGTDPHAPAAESLSPAGAPSAEVAPQAEGEEQPTRIAVRADGREIVYELGQSAAAQGLCDQLPLTVEVEDFSTNEKIFYPPQELEVADAPLAEGGRGVLAYYAPWGDVVLFYGPFDGSGQLYELGRAVSGEGDIEALSGSVTISVWGEERGEH
ncbi:MULTISPECIES: cyclophilin-like fold protein [Eubacteriales]|uniref:Cyclophilin-like domain-containing protein n=1 Tax=Bittarella massiliensis (ex Durand et al. 2017) TaxID=1720313 RepID=A0AAQ1MF73_9FIRM|nr:MULTISPECIES: cyclophilin-like fold protein [Eubacteriales]SHG47534.1 hypothetical protein SAMN05444424_2501 [Bittarella massiliensis (ex Durand et al. 2017)]